MTIKIKIGQKPEEQTIKRKVAVKKSVDGSLMFLTHPHINIVLKEKKVLTFAKDGNYTEDAYAAMKRLMKHLGEAGIISFDSVQGGSIYASLQAKLLEPKEERSILQLATYHIGMFLDEEKTEVYDEYYAQEFNDYLLDPPESEATELGEVPQEEKKGTVPENPYVTPLVYRI